MRILSFACLLAISGAAVAAAPTASADKAEKTADAGDKMICKRFVETGSLVKGYRTCKPKWEWERERENLRSFSVSDSNRCNADPTQTGGCS